MPAAPAENPLLAPWTGPWGGVPPFDRLDLGDLETAVVAAIAMQLEEIATIAANPAPPTFANTIVALERAGAAVHRLETCHGTLRASAATAAVRALDARLAPLWADRDAAIAQNAALFARVEAVYRESEGAGAEARTDPASPNAEERRLIRLVHTRFTRDGAGLVGEARARHAAINRRLAALFTTFRNNLLADEEHYLLLEEAQLDGLPPALCRAAAAAASARGHDGQFALVNTRSAVEPFLSYATDRGAREAVWQAFQDRGAATNVSVVREILQLRDERARLLGYEDFVAWNLDDRMARTPARARGLLEAVWPAAVARAREEVADLQAIADRDGVRLAAWDTLFYADRRRREAYALDSAEVRQYLQLDKLRDALFFVAESVFGMRFTPLPVGAVPVIHPSVRVWEVHRRDDGAPIGLWYLDPFARPGKRSGAWASPYRGRNEIDGEPLVLVSNNANFLPAPAGEPVLVSWDDARILFHEFGHALHLLASTAAYRTLNGCVRDYSELQSQLLEHWLTTDRVIEGFLLHHQTGAPMPATLVARLHAAETFQQGFEATEYLSSAILDLELHSGAVARTALDAELDLAAFEQALLTRLGMPDPIVPRHRAPHFSHLFAGEGYAAGYYGYMWADVLTADAAEAFAEAPGGFYDAAVAERAVTHLFAPRDAVDPAEAWLAFRGREADVGALMRDRGFAKR